MKKQKNNKQNILTHKPQIPNSYLHQEVYRVSK
jgi:hypothetical protein